MNKQSRSRRGNRTDHCTRAAMVSEPNSTPKLPLFSLPRQPPSDPPGMLTPPIQAPASVPFNWEEAPGIPRAPAAAATRPAAARCLELPPRLVGAKPDGNYNWSPTTVLEGPHLGRSLSYNSFSFATGSFRGPQPLRAGRGGSGRREGQLGGSCRWSSSLKGGVEVVGGGGSFDLSSFMIGGGSVADDDGDSDKKEVRSTTRRRSFLGSTRRRFQLWANIYESFKQSVQWRRKQANLRPHKQ